MWKVQIGGSIYPTYFKNITQELNGDEHAFFDVDNTQRMRDLIATTPDVIITFLGVSVFQGILGSWKYKTDKIECKVYDKVYYLMDKKVITANYDTTAGNTILTAVAGEVDGVAAGDCPADNISTRFNKASCYETVKFLADSLNSDYYSSSGTTINIGTRGSAKGRLRAFTEPSKRGVNKYRKRDKVYVRGVDINGNDILGEAGDGTDVQTFTERKASDETTLDNIAAKRLDEINKDSSGVVLEASIMDAFKLYPGDTVTIANPTYSLSGSYRIWRIIKEESTARVEVDYPENLIERILDSQKKLEDLGIYISTPEGILDNPPGAPATPANVIGSNGLAYGIEISWDKNSEADLDAYRILKHTSDDSGSASELTRINSNRFLDRNPAAFDTYYYYWIRAEDRVGNLSPYSTTASGKATQVQTGDLENSLITSLKLASDAVTHAKIDTAAIYGNVVAAKGITTTHITDNAIRTAQISAASIVAGKIAASEVLSIHIKADAITGEKILAGAVTAEKIAASEIKSIHISAYSIISEKISTDEIYGKDIRTASGVGTLAGGPVGVRMYPGGIWAGSGNVPQFWVSSNDGAMYAGGGAVIVDALGITIMGSGYLTIAKEDSTPIGYLNGGIYGERDAMVVQAIGADKDIVLDANGNYLWIRPDINKLQINSSLYPVGTVQLGSTGSEYSEVHSDKVYANNIYGTGHWGDVYFRDLICPICGESFKKGDKLSMYVKATKIDEIVTVPAHQDNCMNLWNQTKRKINGWF